MYVTFRTRALLALMAITAFTTSARAQEAAPQQNALTVEAAIARALATHPRIGAAQQSVRAARGTRLTARSWTNPTLNYQSESMPAAMSANALDREVMTFAMVPLEPLYQLWPRSARASAELRAAEADLASTRRMIAPLIASGGISRVLLGVGRAGQRRCVARCSQLARFARWLHTCARARGRGGGSRSHSARGRARTHRDGPGDGARGPCPCAGTVGDADRHRVVRACGAGGQLRGRRPIAFPRYAARSRHDSSSGVAGRGRPSGRRAIRRVCGTQPHPA